MVSQGISEGISKKLKGCLRWHLVWGENVEFLQKRFDAGKRTSALENRPELYADLADIWNMFWQLHRSRQCGFGPNALSVNDIISLLELYEVIEKIESYELIVAMDNEWLSWASEKEK